MLIVYPISGEEKHRTRDGAHSCSPSYDVCESYRRSDVLELEVAGNSEKDQDEDDDDDDGPKCVHPDASPFSDCLKRW